MNQLKSRLFLSLFLFISLGFSSVQAHKSKVHNFDVIEAAKETFVAEWTEGNAAAIAALYANNSQLFVPAVPDPFIGPGGAQTFIEAAMAAGVSRFAFESGEVELFQHRRKAIDVGTYVLYGEGGEQLDSGPYIIIWKKTSRNQWKIEYDIFNSNVPK